MADRKTIKPDAELFEKLNEHRMGMGEPWDNYLWMLYRNYKFFMEDSEKDYIGGLDGDLTREEVRQIAREEAREIFDELDK